MKKRNKIIIRFKSIWKDHNKSLLIFALTALLIASLTSWDVSYSCFCIEGWAHWIKNFIFNPIGFFGFIIGLITIWGFWFTIETLHDIRNAIHSFPEMIDRVCNLIESTPSEGDEYVKMILYTPTTGCLAVERSRWLDLADLLQTSQPKKSAKAKIRLICLKYEDIAEWYSVYTDPNGKPYSKEEIEFGLERTKEIIDDFESIYEKYKSVSRKKEKLYSEGVTNHKDQINHWNEVISENDHRQIKYIKWEQFRGYYIFCNSKKAIFSLPLFMPTPFSGKITFETGRKPEMIGFESEQFSVLETANRMFDYFWDTNELP